ncbi:TlpA family protein disulfide reductase [Promicromonospora thailandica]|uniref:Thiol-disulfide isomerase or thioredoxin n=1 Tax=Promicromonospora thailandica TaxID=765201 RepID=A0A9X2JU61_9MICO|nr:TlpA disulfide reductase family protein [Promicromonospora thailandica]MCP2263686.1 Thiol-disulfide isomerase or thioredoxin [Promicromonospora thailandica]BFF19109.1 TlpA disulfide reductase family protein [Promicromonospora thailandica]
MRGKTFKVVQWVVAVGIVVGLVAALTACTPEESGAGDVVGQGYVSGDGSVQTYDAGERRGPVAVAGTDFEGNAVDSSDWAGDVVVVNTWYASCAPCRAEAPDLVDLATSKEGVRFLGINTEDDAGAAQAFQRTFEVPYPSIEDRTGTVIAGLNGVVPLQAVPTTVVLDQEGKVAARVIGQAERSTLEALVDEVLAEAT